MKVNQVVLNLENLALENKARVIGVTQSYAYADGKKTEQTNGYAYECVLEKNGFEKISVKVSDFNQIITNEQIAEAKQPIYITFTDFAAKFYFSDRTKNWELSCKATRATLEKTANGFPTKAGQ